MPRDEYDFAAAIDAPVIGSSEVVADTRSTVHWQPVKRSSTFDPLGRASMLSVYQKPRIAWIAGPVASRLGYKVDPVYKRNPLFGIMHALQDIPLLLRKAAARNMMWARRLTNRF